MKLLVLPSGIRADTDFVLSDSIPPVVTGSEDSAAQANDVVTDGFTVKSAVVPVDNDDNSSTESNTL